jgi:hypothetical protein
MLEEYRKNVGRIGRIERIAEACWRNQEMPKKLEESKE